MDKSNKTVIIIVVLAIIVGGGLILFLPSKSDAPGKEKTTSSNSTSEDSSATPTVIITYDGKAFSSSADKLTSGEYVKVTNDSTVDLDFDSDPHPVHTDNSELNEGDIAPGESRTFKLVTKGTWGYHNHLDASQHGKITVE